MSSAWTWVYRGSLWCEGRPALSGPVALTLYIKTLERLVLEQLRPLVKPFLDPMQFAYQPQCGVVDDAIVYLLNHVSAHLCKLASTGQVRTRILWTTLSHSVSGTINSSMWQRPRNRSWTWGGPMCRRLTLLHVCEHGYLSCFWMGFVHNKPLANPSNGDGVHCQLSRIYGGRSSWWVLGKLSD